MINPQHLEIEVNLLNAYMSNPDIFDKIEHLVSENIFLRPATKAAYKIIKGFHQQRVTPDLVLLFSHLKKLGFSATDCAIITGSNYDISYTYQTEKYVEILFKNSAAQYLLPILADTHQKLLSGSGDVLENIEKISEGINRINLVVNNVSKTKSIHDIFDATIEAIKKAEKREVQYMGYSWGLKDLDLKTGGIIQGTNTVAALPGAGKSSLIVNVITTNAIKNDVPMLVFSLEMPAVELMTNIIANMTDINSRALREGDVDAGQWLSIESIKSRLKNNLEIDDTGGITWQYFEAKIKAFRKKHNIPISKTILVAKDYLQLMGNSIDEKKLNPHERLDIICNEQTRICKNENIALIDLSQFNRPSQDRKDIRPRITDLKGSSAIEANSVLILLLFRPEYHGMFNDDKGNDLRGLVEINIGKARYANPEPIYARFVGKYSKFLDYQKPDNQIHTGNNQSF